MRSSIRRRVSCVLFKFHFTNCTTQAHVRVHTLLCSGARALHRIRVYVYIRQQEATYYARILDPQSVGESPREILEAAHTSHPVGTGHFSLLCVSFVRVTSYACIRVPLHVGVRARERIWLDLASLLREEGTVRYV